MNELHVLNGDALEEQCKSFLDPKQVCIAREILMEGPVDYQNISEFWDNRAAFIHDFFGEEKTVYLDKVLPEFEKISSLSAPHKIYLWFEFDLFCQVNFWFTLNLIRSINLEHQIYWVRPNTKDWKGFGVYSPERLKDLWQDAYQLSHGEIQTLNECWNAYQKNDKTKFQEILERSSLELHFLNDIIEAHFSRLPNSGQLTRPEKSLIEISKAIKSKDFAAIFPLFSAKEGIYGYGYLQVEKLWNSILLNHSELLY